MLVDDVLIGKKIYIFSIVCLGMFKIYALRSIIGLLILKLDDIGKSFLIFFSYSNYIGIEIHLLRFKDKFFS